ncbi:hypothetical protein D3C85_243930 [compost metagenome]
MRRVRRALAQGERVETALLGADRRQHAGRGRQRHVRQLGALLRQRRGAIGAAARLVQQRGHGGDALEQFAGPGLQGDMFAVAFQQQSRTAPFLDGAGEILGVLAAFRIAGERAVLQRAKQQKGVEEVTGRRADAQRLERVDIEAAHFHVLHAALGQRMQRALAAVRHALGPDRRVVLVLDLQAVGIDLHPLPVAPRAQLDIRQVGMVHRRRQAGDIAVERVVVGGQAGLGIVLVAHVAHAQAGGVRQVHGIGRQLLQREVAASREMRRQRWRGAEQIHQQPAVAAEVADQRDIAFRLKLHRRAAIALVRAQALPQCGRQRVVVVDAGDALHALAVAQRQAAPIDMLEHADVRAAVPGDRDIGVGGQPARHRVAPQHFVAQAAEDETVQGVVAIEHGSRVLLGRRDQLDQRLRIVGSDGGMGQRSAQRQRMRRGGQVATAVHAQRFAFDAAQSLGQQRTSVRVCQQRHTARQ